jgi:hypothetical protein
VAAAGALIVVILTALYTVTSRSRSHPALVAVGVVAVERLFGFVGLIVAVPILATVKILIEEAWVKPLERPNRRTTITGARARRRAPWRLVAAVRAGLSAVCERDVALGARRRARRLTVRLTEPRCSCRRARRVR